MMVIPQHQILPLEHGCIRQSLAKEKLVKTLCS